VQADTAYIESPACNGFSGDVDTDQGFVYEDHHKAISSPRSHMCDARVTMLKMTGLSCDFVVLCKRASAVPM
jgi:hypothetical protein